MNIENNEINFMEFAPELTGAAKIEKAKKFLAEQAHEELVKKAKQELLRVFALLHHCAGWEAQIEQIDDLRGMMRDMSNLAAKKAVLADIDQLHLELKKWEAKVANHVAIQFGVDPKQL